MLGSYCNIYTLVLVLYTSLMTSILEEYVVPKSNTVDDTSDGNQTLTSPLLEAGKTVDRRRKALRSYALRADI